MRVSITEMAVRKQLTAMGCDRFDIGVLRRSGRMLLRERWNAARVEHTINWLKHENARGAHVFARPHGAHGLSLIDDLTSAVIVNMKQRGFQPALIIETSPDNFQVWLKHARILDHELSTQAAKELARRFGGDPSSADWRHFGRLAGFTNQKPGRRLANGLPPFVRLRECSGVVYGAAEDFLKQVVALAVKARAEREAIQRSQSHRREDVIRSLADFHCDPRYGGDLHRADMAWALYAASRGLSKQGIEVQLLNGRDLSKKGWVRRQLSYAERTADKAVAAARPFRS